MLDENGEYAARSPFAAVADTATTEARPALVGGWHDAGDFDRRSMHIRAAMDLVTTILVAPENFADQQLGIPESGNGLPDLLDEVRFGMEVWRAAQTTAGAVPTWIEATSHPNILDPGADTQPYYVSLATRNSSLHYAHVAALLARALRDAGAIDDAAAWLESAHAAFAFGTDPTVRVEHTFIGTDGVTRRFVEAEAPNPVRVLWARIALAFADDDVDYRAALAADQPVFTRHLGELWWRNRLSLVAPLLLEPWRYPEGWAELCEAALRGRADEWLEGQAELPYGRAWYPEAHRYFSLVGWGIDTYVPARDLALAFRLTGDAGYRAGALRALSYLHGANPMGRVHVTGLGDHFAATALHLPSFTDGIDEPVPGIPLYGVIGGVAYAARTRVYGLQLDARADPPFPGVEQVMLPPSLAEGVPDLGALGEALPRWIPPWRRYVQLESQVVPSMEFAVADTQAYAISATGLLMTPGFTSPGPRIPRDAAALRSSRRVMP